MGDTPAWLAADSSSGAVWSGTLEEFGLLSGNSLQYAELTGVLYEKQTASDRLASGDCPAVSELDCDLVGAADASGARPTPRRLNQPTVE
ncbi:MAG: hypothetical protein IPO36_19260 [Anaerolineales bacterium]|nr:hypothetical protein [Anaerolineales bacterium]